jgi:hypothetical protein
MSGNVAPHIVYDSSLVLYLDAANPNSYPGSGTTWYDLSQYKNNVTLSGSTLPTYSTTYNGSFYFNGAGLATASSNSSLNISRPTVIVACTTGSLSNQQVIIAKGRAGNSYNYGIQSVQSTAFNGINTTCPNGVSGLPATTIPMNIYAAAWDGTAVQYYRNGVYVGSDTTCYSPILNNNFGLVIGAAEAADNISYGSFFTGSIAVVQIYNRQLSSTEIIQNQNALKGRFGL